MKKKPLSIAVLNHKGGVGKTATVAGLASAISKNYPEKKILIIDADEQANIKTIFGIKLRDSEGSLASVLTENTDPTKCVIEARKNIDIILSGGKKLGDFNKKFSSFPKAEELMKERFYSVNEYDIILIDCPPSLSLISSNVGLYADYVLIPAAPDLLSVVAVKATVAFLEELKDHFGYSAKVLGVVPTMHDVRRNMDIDILEDLERLEASGLLRGGVCFSEVRSDVKFKTAQVKRKLIHEAFPESKVAKDYEKVMKEILREVEGASSLNTARLGSSNVTQLQNHESRTL